ncbi:hypothetical protein SCHPADRAFT_948126 [Schizopora paradoxa]|uniref:Uncharacterized protein n=1 Tax=Schizopora paradoxa TaxID=27342 RepID=A0A0H2QWM3_9AGAM|nr:hypothetical protein SCHPADRAFT_948126 [Schizopora paradoxa]
MTTYDDQQKTSTKPPMTAVYLQDACYKHRYMRTNDHSNIVERPERLRAVKIGLAAAIARLEELSDSTAKPETKEGEDDTGKDLAAALEKLDLLQDNAPAATVVNIIKSSASIDLLNNEAIKFVHGDIDGDVYLENLIDWAKSSMEKGLSRSELGIWRLVRASCTMIANPEGANINEAKALAFTANKRQQR